MDKPIVVIGAGFSGVTAVKCCIESGLQVICFEKTNLTGGLWRYRNDDLHGVASVMKSTVINTSKEMNAFSDFVPDKELPNYMHNTKMVHYLDNYIEHFNILPHVKLEHEVLSAEMCADFSNTGEWRIRVKDLKKEEEHEIIAAGLMVCAGHHVYPNIPTFPGIKEFNGPVLHSHSYKDFKGFEDKRVLVIGIGNSGVDLAVDLSKVASQVYLSTRKGTWLLYRVGENGTPLDLQDNWNRWNTSLFQHFPTSLTNYLATKQINSRIDHGKYNLKPEHTPYAAHPTANDDLPNRIISGYVVIKKDVHKFTKNGVHFQYEEDIEYPIDAVLLATGYIIKFPFLSQDILPISQNSVALYKRIFPPQLDPPTLAMIGLVQPIGSIIALSEMQSRLAVQVFLKKIKLPSRVDMVQDITMMQEAVDKRYVKSPRHTIQVDYLPYMDEIAEMFGAKPHLFNLLWKDPKLWHAILFGPNISYQYRLQGPHPWPGAREAILNLWDRVNYPLNPRYKEQRGFHIPKILLILLLIAFVLYLY